MELFGNLRLTKSTMTISCKKATFGCEASMKQTIEDIRGLLKSGAFTDEQHVRFSLVGRLCQALGWNIWNPAEFYTEFQVKKLPLKDLSKDVRGWVDVALFIPQATPEGAEVFIEVKTPGKLDSDLAAGEMQLHLYNAYHKSAISVLTDGIQWRFYLPSAGGEFEDKLFNHINILKDDPDDIAQTFLAILHRDNFRPKALQTAEEMRRELAKIKLINCVKEEALAMHEKTDIPLFLIAKQLLQKNHKTKLEQDEIERLWNKKHSGIRPKKKGDTPESIPIQTLDESSVYTDVLKDYRFLKPRFIILPQLGKIEISYWRDLKREVYNWLLKIKSNLVLTGIRKFSKDKGDFVNPISLIDGYFGEGNLNATNIVKHSRKAMAAAGFDPLKDLIIGYSYTSKRRKQ